VPTFWLEALARPRVARFVTANWTWRPGAKSSASRRASLAQNAPLPLGLIAAMEQVGEHPLLGSEPHGLHCLSYVRRARYSERASSCFSGEATVSFRPSGCHAGTARGLAVGQIGLLAASLVDGVAGVDLPGVDIADHVAVGVEIDCDYVEQPVNFLRVPSRGSSMWPTVRDGDVLLVDRAALPTVGDIVVARAGKGFIAHRLVARDAGRVRCANARGDLDPWIDEESLFGRVAGIERGGRLLEVGRQSRNVHILWALRSSYGVVRRVAQVLRRSLRDRQA
jgi:signal peptidase I